MSDDTTSAPGDRPDPMRVLSTAEVATHLPPGWAHFPGSLKARYRTGDFATGLQLADRIGESAERWDHHPDIALTYRDVVVTLVSHDVGGITSRDLRMARLTAEHAAALGVKPDVTGITQVDPGLDTPDPTAIAPFYSALFAAPLRRGEPVDPSGQTPTLWWQTPQSESPSGGDASTATADEDAAGSAAGPTTPADASAQAEHEQRWHFDVWVAPEAAQQRLAAVLGAGGRLVSDANAPAFWVVADADGNRHCICTTSGR